MKNISLLALFAFANLSLLAQKPSFTFTKNELEIHLKYLASDELGGRRTASTGGKMAADYIAQQLNTYGVKPVPGQKDFFQKIPFSNVQPPMAAAFTIGEASYRIDDNLLIINGADMDTQAEVVFAGNGWVDASTGVDDYQGLDVKGKIVVVVTGLPDANTPMDVFRSMVPKQKFAEERGAIALIEAYRLALPWPFAKSYFGKERMEVSKADGTSPSFVYGWAQEKNPGTLSALLNKQKTIGSLKVAAGQRQQLEAYNLVGVIEGTDAASKDEFVLLSAHYDHVGVGMQGGAAFTPQDSIFNGTRDNGIGTVALLAAAKELAANPPKRSVLLLACTGEELGMLGSNWYVENPLVPLDKMVFNFNTDGAGYNSTAHFNVIGKGLTNVDAEMEMAGQLIGLTMLGDPAPEQNFYTRSDNISFANQGIPAVDFAPGITEMNEEIYKYYHQAADNADSIDYDYLLKFCKSYTLAARMIADKQGKIEWIGEGKAYEK